MKDSTIKFQLKKWPVLLLFFLMFAITHLTMAQRKITKKGIEMARKMADSEMIHFPESWTVDFNPKGGWNYTPGLIATSMIEIWKRTGDSRYYDYAKSYADKFINADGKIDTYKPEEYNIDRLNSGKFLFALLEKTGEKKYETAIHAMREQLKTHPRTREGGFWHKKIYPHQMWLDGLYMGAPFYAQYARKFNQPEAFTDIITQFAVVHLHTYNDRTGLNFHGWDESREQKWANSEAGTSPNYWGRAQGWYAMALVDVLDFIPLNHPRRAEVVKILREVASGIKKYQDKKTGLWYQVLDQGNREGNYLEATASSMFVYALLKGVRNGYLPETFQKTAIKGFQGILANLIKTNENGTISLTQCCSVAGLGGTPYRDGSYEYYIGEPVRDNDPKGVGPFILASLEINLIK